MRGVRKADARSVRRCGGDYGERGRNSVRQDEQIGEDEIRICLALAVAECGLGNFSKRYGINMGNLYLVLKGHYKPQPEQLAVLGLKKRMTITYERAL